MYKYTIKSAVLQLKTRFFDGYKIRQKLKIFCKKYFHFLKTSGILHTRMYAWHPNAAGKVASL